MRQAKNLWPLFSSIPVVGGLNYNGLFIFFFAVAAFLMYKVYQFKHEHRHAMSNFTDSAVFQNLLGGAVIFLNFTVLFHHFVYIDKNCQQSKKA